MIFRKSDLFYTGKWHGFLMIVILNFTKGYVNRILKVCGHVRYIFYNYITKYETSYNILSSLIMRVCMKSYSCQILKLTFQFSKYVDTYSIKLILAYIKRGMSGSGPGFLNFRGVVFCLSYSNRVGMRRNKKKTLIKGIGVIF